MFQKPDNTSYYEIKGVRRRIPAPSYKHLVNTPKGKLLRLYSPTPDEYYIVPLRKPETRSLEELMIKDKTTGKSQESRSRRMLSRSNWLELNSAYIRDLLK